MSRSNAATGPLRSAWYADVLGLRAPHPHEIAGRSRSSSARAGARLGLFADRAAGLRHVALATDRAGAGRARRRGSTASGSPIAPSATATATRSTSPTPTARRWRSWSRGPEAHGPLRLLGRGPRPHALRDLADVGARALAVALRDPAHAALHVPWLRSLSGRLDGLALERAVVLLPPRGYTPDFLTPPPAGPLGSIADDFAALRATRTAQIRDEMALFASQHPKAARASAGSRTRVARCAARGPARGLLGARGRAGVAAGARVPGRRHRAPLAAPRRRRTRGAVRGPRRRRDVGATATSTSPSRATTRRSRSAAAGCC